MIKVTDVTPGSQLSPASDTLYHYTSIAGLLGIVESRSLWASHAYYLNDSEEIIYAAKVLGRIVSEKASDFIGEEMEFLRQFAKWLDTFRSMAYHVFIFSLSEDGNLLSQWRSYTPHGKGVSIGFRPGVLEEAARTCGGKLVKCVYGREEHTQLVSTLVDEVVTIFRQRLPSFVSKASPSQKYHPLLEELRGNILQVLPIIKRGAFREEREWRIVWRYFSRYTVPEVKFREGASMLLPYTELPLRISEGTILEEVVLGPSPHVSLSVAALSSFLSNQKLCNRTRDSGIPFRKW